MFRAAIFRASTVRANAARRAVAMLCAGSVAGGLAGSLAGCAWLPGGMPSGKGRETGLAAEETGAGYYPHPYSDAYAGPEVDPWTRLEEARLGEFGSEGSGSKDVLAGAESFPYAGQAARQDVAWAELAQWGITDPGPSAVEDRARESTEAFAAPAATGAPVPAWEARVSEATVSTTATGVTATGVTATGLRRFRGGVSFGVEAAVSGELLETVPESLGATGPAGVSPAGVSYGDAYGTATRVAGELGYALTPRTELFGEVGYAVARGETVGARDGPQGGSLFAPATVSGETAGGLDVNDLRRVDLVAGARHRFGPLGFASVGTVAARPFVAGSVGASRLNATRLDTVQDGVPVAVELFDAGWVPRGALGFGLEWRTSERVALGIETGVSVEGGRDSRLAGERADARVSVPFTLRGAFRF